MEFSTALILIAILASTVTMTLAAAIRSVLMPKGPVKPNSYIVALKSGTDMEDHIEGIARISARSPGSEFSITQRYRILNGYAAHATGASLTRILNCPDVDYVQADGIAFFDYGLRQVNHEDADVSVEMGDDPAGLEGRAGSGPGDGVDIYGVDSGVFYRHLYFGGRAALIAFMDGSLRDVSGHGTALAGVAMGSVFGKATSALMFGVKVTNDENIAEISNVIAGLDFVVERFRKRGRPAIALVPVIGESDEGLNNAVRGAIALGLHVVVGAGNDGMNAEGFSPASVGEAITVGAINNCYELTEWSNWGRDVDILAPGVDIVSTGIGGETAVSVKSGTSMSAAQVAGELAVALGQYGQMTPAALKAALLRRAIPMAKVQRRDTTSLVAAKI
ncbi:peptidase S8/S53 domain-containing protein [Cantharellus anzutake]|uniref:peptidase S8/S53 domain-containing protein n=1 Tax=Cantharellus anzutake TaxID=1750568 RepID=UPI0019076CC0|nr:peptidase S8/S53 domain-containing protein [Cantharellus anzutake]KAF8344025.1 peptidase S8/S53 domain-containing protein [Cantharellus anzutake]